MAEDVGPIELRRVELACRAIGSGLSDARTVAAQIDRHDGERRVLAGGTRRFCSRVASDGKHALRVLLVVQQHDRSDLFAAGRILRRPAGIIGQRQAPRRPWSAPWSVSAAAARQRSLGVGGRRQNPRDDDQNAMPIGRHGESPRRNALTMRPKNAAPAADIHCNRN